MASDSIPEESSWHAMFIVDSSLHIPVNERFLPWEVFRPRRVINSVTIPDLSNSIYSLSYRRSLSTQKSKLCYLLSKVLNEKCQARKFSSVFLDCYEPKHNIAKYIKSIVLCGLLGAYPTSKASSRPKPEVRKRLYELISNCSNYGMHFHAKKEEIIKKEENEVNEKQKKKANKFYDPSFCKVCMVQDVHGGPEAEQWFLFLLTFGGIVVLYCIREYVNYMLSLNPCLLNKIREEIKYDETLEVTNKAMCTIRKYFDDHLTNPFSDMYTFTESIMNGSRLFDPKYTGNSDPSSWFYQLSCIMYPYQKNMLLISHTRSNKTMQESLLTACKKLNMVPLPSKRHLVVTNEKENKVNNQNNLAKEEEIKMYNQQLDQQFEIEDETHSNLIEDSMVSEHRKMIGVCISPKQKDAIYLILKRVIKNDSTDTIERISKYLTLFGVDVKTKNFIRSMVERRKQNMISDEKLRRFLVLLQQRKPHAYNLLQTTAYLSHNIIAYSIICILPNYIIRNQISAIQSCFGQFVVGSNVIPATSCNVLYCSVCHTIYSIIRDFMYGSKQAYEYGVLNALADHKTGHMYCKNNFTSSDGSCERTPLVSVNILGLMMRIKDQPIMLCPQLHCGAPMVYSNQCAWTERGPCCSKCTVKRYSDVSVKLDTATSLLEQPFNKLDPMTFPSCAICGCILPSLGKMFWYPHSVVVCCFHTSSSIQKKFKEISTGMDLDKEKVKEILECLLHERKLLIQQRRQAKDRKMWLAEQRKRKNGLGVSFDKEEKKEIHDDPMELC